MNLVDLLAPKSLEIQQGAAEKLETAESLQLHRFGNPPPLSESGGSNFAMPAFRQNPPPQTESECQPCSVFPPNPPNPPTVTINAEKPLPVSSEYFAAQGLNMLPDDLVFLRWHLPKGAQERNAVIKRYIDIWREVAAAELLPGKRESVGRRAANTWLRCSDGSVPPT